jgi:hypothetical protein
LGKEPLSPKPLACAAPVGSNAAVMTTALQTDALMLCKVIAADFFLQDG